MVLVNGKRRLLRRSGAPRERFVAQGLRFAIMGMVGLFLLAFVVFALFSTNLPSPTKLSRQDGASTTFLDRNDKVIFEMYQDKNRVPITINQVPLTLRQATIAIEDKEFYEHEGFSVRGLIRAGFVTVFLGRREGGSTLTQQLVKNVLLSPERTLTRKIKEFILATEIERRYTKDEILQMYLNEAPYGGTMWGIESAAKGYFGKSAKEVNLAESAFLAGLPQLPSVYSPFIGKSDAYIGRSAAVLRRMREDGYISRDEEKKAFDEVKRMKFEAPHSATSAAHFVFYVRAQLASLLGEKVLDQGLRIKTTLDLELQQNAEKIVKDEIEKIKKLNATNGAVVVMDSQKAEILAMVGSYDYNDTKYGRFNTATALRQPGSAIKPITYATAFEEGYTPATVIMDVQTEFPDQGGKVYKPVNYDGRYRGVMQARFALGNSINVPAVKILAMVGVRTFLEKAHAMGLTTFAPTDENMKRFGLAITLGGGETRLVDLTGAFSTFARGGMYKDYSSIMEVKDYRGKTIYKAKKPTEKRVLSEGVAFLISHILSDNVARTEVFGPRSYLNVGGKTVAVKTGTTNDKRDNWTVGYTKGVTVGTWVGNNDNSPMNERIASGVTGASPIWNRVMAELLKSYPDGIGNPPSSVTALQIDAFLGGLPHAGGQTRSEYFVKGTEPKAISPFYKKLKISRSTGKIANDVEARIGDYEEKEYIVITEADPVSTDGKNRWQEAIDAWAYSQGDERFKPPRDTSDVKSDEIAVSIKEPLDKARIDGSEVKLRARITSLDPVTKIEIIVNGVVQKTYTDDREETIDFLTLSTGTYELRVRAENSKGKSGDSIIHIGVNKNWDEGVTPTP